MAVPYTFASATGSIPLSQLDTNFATAIVIGNTSVSLGNTITTLNNITLANATISSVVFASGASLANVTLTGTTTVTGNITVSGNSTVSGSTTVSGNSTVSGNLTVSSGNVSSGAGVPLVFSINNVEAARIATGAQLLVGVTSATGAAGTVQSIGYVGRSGTAGSFSNVFNIYWTGAVAQLWIDSTNIGSLTISSDYRVKQNVVTQTANAVDRINALRPVQYQFKDAGIFKADGVTREGFIAHELQEIIPSAVTGVKDAVTDNQEIQPQSLNLDALVSVLTKAVQELSARVAVLEAKP